MNLWGTSFLSSAGIDLCRQGYFGTKILRFVFIDTFIVPEIFVMMRYCFWCAYCYFHRFYGASVFIWCLRLDDIVILFFRSYSSRVVTCFWSLTYSFTNSMSFFAPSSNSLACSSTNSITFTIRSCFVASSSTNSILCSVFPHENRSLCLCVYVHVEVFLSHYVVSIMFYLTLLYLTFSWYNLALIIVWTGLCRILLLNYSEFFQAFQTWAWSHLSSSSFCTFIRCWISLRETW